MRYYQVYHDVSRVMTGLRVKRTLLFSKKRIYKRDSEKEREDKEENKENIRKGMG